VQSDWQQLHAKHSAAAANSSTDQFSSTIRVPWWTKPANRDKMQWRHGRFLDGGMDCV
jgi:hypothetical protein